MNVTEEMYNYISKECPLLEQFAVAKRNFDDTEMDLSFFLKHWKNTFINNKALEYMSNCRNLQDLCICYSDKSAVTDEGILALSRGCIQLKKVDFEGCLGITDYGIMELSRHCHGLCFVNLCNCYHITGFGFYCLVINCPRLQEVQMHSCPFVKEILRNDDSFPEVSISSLFENVAAVGTKCDCIEIYNSWESWDSYSESKCCPIVIQGQNEIKVLYGLTDEMIRQCSRSNQYEETQTGFQLTDLEDRDLSKDPTAVHHLQAPFDCSRIQKLDLSNCRRICDSDVLRICKHFPEIRNLNLAHNFKLSDTSVTAVSRQLTLLKVLDLKGIENLTNASLNYLLERSLEFFSFSPYSQVSVTGLRNFLVCSKNLKEIKLNFKVDISAKLTPDIIRSMLSEEDCGFFMTLGELSSYVIIASRCSKYD
ncbi:F-box/LRR-repeat protein 2-like [Saccostrea cucullata]|uniref:F-box/LRR-repeat protein 2-like n=1 Tax=Saccostrea cuccullata TaxID=36930 RepID=UPI002ED09A20